MELVRKSHHFLHWKGEETLGSTESSSELTGREGESGPPTLGHLEGRCWGRWMDEVASSSGHLTQCVASTPSAHSCGLGVFL